jgi:uncharacterized repeat protein (TIGR03803 family)
MVLARQLLIGTSICAFVLTASISLLPTSATASEKVLYSFQGGKDGVAPFSALVADQSGNLYGTTAGGGRGMGCSDGGHGCGTIFRLAPNGREKQLYAFKGGSDGGFPRGGLIVDNAGNYYGTTTEGGSSEAGTVFKLAAGKAESVLYSFTGGSAGANPEGTLVQDSSGNFYGGKFGVRKFGVRVVSLRNLIILTSVVPEKRAWRGGSGFFSTASRCM